MIRRKYGKKKSARKLAVSFFLFAAHIRQYCNIVTRARSRFDPVMVRCDLVYLGMKKGPKWGRCDLLVVCMYVHLVPVGALKCPDCHGEQLARVID